MATTHIAIHGVGDATPGAVLAPLSNLVAGDSAALRMSTRVIGGRRYAVVQSEHSDAPSFIEVNWADIERPVSSWIGLVRFLPPLVLAQVFVGDRWPEADETSRPGLCCRVYRYFFEYVLVWTMLLPAVSLCLARPAGIEQVAAYYLGLAALGVLVFTLRRAIPWWTGVPGLVTSALIGGMYLWGLPPDPLTRFVAASYSCVQFCAGVLLVLAALEILTWGDGSRPIVVRLTRLSFLYLPLVAVACFGPAVTSFAGLLCEKDDVLSWSRAFKSGLCYDLAAGELVMAATIALMGGVALLGALAYLVLRDGGFARRWLRLLLWIWPLLLFANGVICGFLVFVGPPPWWWSLVVEWDAIDIYQWSALRVLPFLPFLVGPMAIVADIVSDVTFYLLPPQHRLSTRIETRRRLAAVLSWKRKRDPQGHLCIYAHSQGSVIASDVLSGNDWGPVELVTLGSPISTLYGHFVGWKTGAPPVTQRGQWRNLYRTGDYIGGAIALDGVENFEIGPGGHVNYWTDPAITG